MPPSLKSKTVNFGLSVQGLQNGIKNAFLIVLNFRQKQLLKAKQLICVVSILPGQKSREILQRLSNQDLSNSNWPFMHSGRLSIAGVECLALRISFSGDLGWEIYCDAEYQEIIYKTLIKASIIENGGPVWQQSSDVIAHRKGLRKLE